MNNPLTRKYTSIRKAKKTYKKEVGRDFPRWYLYKKWFMRIALQPWKELPPKWNWLRHSPMFYDFERSFAIFHLDWSQEMIDELTPKKGTYYFSQKS